MAGLRSFSSHWSVGAPPCYVHSEFAHGKVGTMLFVIIGHDGPDGATLRPKVRPAHLENLRPLVERGRVIIAGPFTDGSGSLIVIDMESEAEALELAQNDPYVKEGVFERVEVKPFQRVFP
jgi:uncharacterized protein